MTQSLIQHKGLCILPLCFYFGFTWKCYLPGSPPGLSSGPAAARGPAGSAGCLCPISGRYGSIWWPRRISCPSAAAAHTRASLAAVPLRRQRVTSPWVQRAAKTMFEHVPLISCELLGLWRSFLLSRKRVNYKWWNFKKQSLLEICRL